MWWQILCEQPLLRCTEWYLRDIFIMEAVLNKKFTKRNHLSASWDSDFERVCFLSCVPGSKEEEDSLLFWLGVKQGTRGVAWVWSRLQSCQHLWEHQHWVSKTRTNLSDRRKRMKLPFVFVPQQQQQHQQGVWRVGGNSPSGSGNT